MLGLAGVYALTGFEPLLLIAFLLQIEVVHQMLPFLRLDGYYVVSDLVGVPDLFKRTGPVLRSMIPGRSASRRCSSSSRGCATWSAAGSSWWSRSCWPTSG